MKIILYILIEKNYFNITNIIGIFNYNDAYSEKKKLESINTFNKYEIQGPFNYESNFTNNIDHEISHYNRYPKLLDDKIFKKKRNIDDMEMG